MINSNKKSVPKHVNELSKIQLEEALSKKKEHNAKALRIVENMLENNISEQWFLENLQFIRKTHFDDIIEERSILNCCGYPLCQENLKIMPCKQYQISTKLNKVFDTTQRKKFCSDQCYRAAKVIKDQLLSSPLWFSAYEETPNFHILPVQNVQGMQGDEVDLGRDAPLRVVVKTSENIVREVRGASESREESSSQTVEASRLKSDMETSKPTSIEPPSCVEYDVAHSKLNACNLELRESNTEQACLHSKDAAIEAQHDEENQTLNSNIHMKSIDTTKELTNSKGTNQAKTVHRVTSTVKPAIKARTKTPEEQNKSKPGSINCVLHVENCLHDWFNLETLIYLFGEEKVKEMIVNKGKSIKEYYKVVSNAAWDPKLQVRYESICKRLNLMELEDSYHDQKLTSLSKELKPLPDYSIIKQESMKLEMKINAYYQGKLMYVEDLSSVENASRSEETTEDPMLPLVDLHAQKSYRRKIVQDRLTKVLPDLLETFGLDTQSVKAEVKLLVRTFSLEAHNICFNPSEWNLLGLIIVNMLALKDGLLKATLETEQARKYRTLMLIPYHQEAEYIRTLLTWLTDIDNIVENQRPL